MHSTRTWTVLGAASVLGLGAAGISAVTAANAMNFVASGVGASLTGISTSDDRPATDIPSTLSAVSAPNPVETSSAPSPESSDSPVSAVSPVSSESPESSPSPASPVSPASPISAESPQSPESPESAESSD